MKEFLKKNWKIILIVVLCMLFLGTCAKKNNYRRKLNNEYTTTASYADSMNNVIKWHEARFDSVCKVNEKLRNEIEGLNKEVNNLNKDIDIYKDQNDKLHQQKIVIIQENNND